MRVVDIESVPDVKFVVGRKKDVAFGDPKSCDKVSKPKRELGLCLKQSTWRYAVFLFQEIYANPHVV